MSTRYEAIAQRVARSIHSGVLQSGERLPSLRELCRREGVSLMTALAAYRQLEAQSLIEALPRSGYRVCAPRLPEPARAAITRPRLAAHSEERDALAGEVLRAIDDPKLVPLGLGCPSPDLYPLAALRRITGHVLAERPELWTTYSPPPGLLGLRRLIARRLCARGLMVEPHEVLLTTGAMEALSMALRVLVKPGELVLVECPTYFGVLDAARSAGVRILELSGHPEHGLDPERLDELCRQRPVRAAALIPTFANPTGSLMSEARKRACIAVLKARGVALVEDDLYGELAFDRKLVPPMAAFAAREQPFILAGSLSKTLLPGARVGYLVARSPWIERALVLKQSSTLANVTLAEHVAHACLESGLLDRHLRALAPKLETNVQRMQAAVVRHFPAGTRVTRPRGGFLLWVELPHGCDGLSLFQSARAGGISIVPGQLFSLAGGLERYIRLNAAAARPAVDRALITLGRMAVEQLQHAPLTAAKSRRAKPVS
jgi:DNA-binding transcriptional MocR family regulator